MPTIKIVPFPGSAGQTGPQGAQGVAGPQGPAGDDALWNYVGEYNNGYDYQVGDIATYAGSLWYRSGEPNVGYAPSEESQYWDLLASKGTNGEGVPDGGITGYYLAKSSEVDQDVAWIDPSVIKLRKVSETFTEKTGATGVVVHDCSAGHIFTHSAMSANFTANLTNLNLDEDYATTVTLVLNQGSNARIPNALQIGGVGQTINWQGGVVPSGYANKKDVVSFSILRTGAAIYTVFGQLVSFG